MKLSVIIPVRNEAAHIGPTLEAIRSRLVGEDIHNKILVVDDGSPDSAAEEVSERSAIDRAVRLIEKKGASRLRSSRARRLRHLHGRHSRDYDSRWFRHPADLVRSASQPLHRCPVRTTLQHHLPSCRDPRARAISVSTHFNLTVKLPLKPSCAATPTRPSGFRGANGREASPAFAPEGNG
jgi:hypothetical protein